MNQTASTSQGPEAVFGVGAGFFWLAAGVAVGLATLVAAAGTWSDGIWAVTVGAVGSVLLSAVASGIEYRRVSPVVISVVCALVGSTITVAWFSQDVRQKTLGVAGDYMPSSALKLAYASDSDEVARAACRELIDKGGTVALKIDNELTERPRVAAQCVKEHSDETARNVERRLENRWNQRLLLDGSIADCDLVAAYHQLSSPDTGGQRTLLIGLTAASTTVRQCASDIAAPKLMGSASESLGFLGEPTALDPGERLRLFKALSAVLHGDESERRQLKSTELVRAWNVSLGCGALESGDPDAAATLNSVARAQGCGFVPQDDVASTWVDVCERVSNTGLKKVVDEACKQVTAVAEVRTFSLARSIVTSATRAMQQGRLSGDIHSGRDKERFLSQYEERFGAEGMKESLRDADMPPSLRAQLIRDIGRAQGSTRQWDPSTLKALKNIEDVDAMNQDNLARAMSVLKMQGGDLEKELRERGVDSEALKNEELQELLGKAREKSTEIETEEAPK